MLSNVVYKFTCRQCNATYVGETSRHLQTRIAEHRGLSARTGHPVSYPVNSHIRDHCIENNHDLGTGDFEILCKTDNFDVRMAESILINKIKPNLNCADSSVPVHIIT